MKKRILPALLALVMVLGMLPLTVFAEADEGGGDAATPAKVVNYGFVWTAPSEGEIQGTGATAGSDWLGETMYIVTDNAIGSDKYMWIKVTFGTEEWGCYAGNSDTATTYAFSFLNRAGQWEQKPDSVKSETTNATKYLENKLTDSSLSVTLEVYSNVTYKEGSAPESLPAKADFKRTITLTKDAETKCYNGYPVSEWIGDMQTAINGISISDGVVTLTSENRSHFLNVWANRDVFDIPEDLKTEEQKTAITGFRTTLQGVKKIDASGLDANKLTGLGTLSPFTKLEELNFSGNAVADGTNGNAGVLDVTEISVWKTTLKSLDLSDTNVSNIEALKDFSALETLDISGTGVTSLNVLAHLTGLKNLTATKLQNVNLLGLAALVNKNGFDAEKLTVNLGADTDASTLAGTLSDAEKRAVNTALEKLGERYTGPKYDEVTVAAAYQASGLFGGQIKLTGLDSGKYYLCQITKTTPGGGSAAIAMKIATPAEGTHTIDVNPIGDCAYKVEVWACDTDANDLTAYGNAVYRETLTGGGQ